MNRKIETKSIESDVERDTFADLSEKEFRDLKRQAPWLQANYLDEKEMSEFVAKVSDKVGRNIQLSSYVPEIGLEALTKSLDSLVFYHEIRAKCALTTNKSPLIHQRSKHSNDHTRLFKWDIFSETTEPFISPIQYRVKNNKRNIVTHPSNSLYLSNKDLRVVVQDKLIESHFEPTAFIVPELVEPIERVLTTSLINIVLFREMALFFFEWTESMAFLFVMAFRLSSLNETSRRLLQYNVVTLHRKDVMEFFDNPDPDIKEDDDDTDASLPLPQTKGLPKKDLLKFLTTEMDDEGMDVEEPIIATKIKHISSSKPEQEFALKSFITNVRTSHISYMTSAYVKRD